MKDSSPKEIDLQYIHNKESNTEFKLDKIVRIQTNQSRKMACRHILWNSAIMRCALFGLGPIGALVAWHVAMRSLTCHMGSSYLVWRTAY